MLHNAFELGFDHFIFGIPMSDKLLFGKIGDYVQQGYTAAKIQNVSTKKPDIFDKKLIQIKDRAIHKGLEVTITKHDLRERLIEAGCFCPITRVMFTFASNTDTDWSVDRINNSLGYTPDNIIIISKRANTAKSNMDLVDIITNSMAQKPGSLLSDEEWQFMAELYYDKLQLDSSFSFCRLLSDREKIFRESIFFQLYHYDNPLAKPIISKLERIGGKSIVQKAKKLVKKRTNKRIISDAYALYASPKLLNIIETLKTIIKNNSLEFDNLMADFLFGTQVS